MSEKELAEVADAVCAQVTTALMKVIEDFAPIAKGSEKGKAWLSKEVHKFKDFLAIAKVKLFKFNGTKLATLKKKLVEDRI